MEVVSALRLFGPMVLAAVRGGLLDAKSQCIFCMSGDLCVRVVYAECGALHVCVLGVWMGAQCMRAVFGWCTYVRWALTVRAAQWRV